MVGTWGARRREGERGKELRLLFTMISFENYMLCNVQVQEYLIASHKSWGIVFLQQVDQQIGFKGMYLQALLYYAKAYAWEMEKLIFDFYAGFLLTRVLY